MDTLTRPRVATRYECSLRDVAGHHHSSGTGSPRRRCCAHCGGSFVVLSGWWGVFVHSSVSGDARYRAETAQSLHSTERSAQRVIDTDTTGTLVTRWVAA